LPPFSLYNVIGKLTVNSQLCHSESKFKLTQDQRDLIDWFHNFIFTETLQFQVSSLTENGCRVVLLKYGDSSNTEPSVINFNEMELLRRNACESDGKFSCGTDLLDSVVVKAYRSQNNPDSRHYMVISTGGDPSSQFPNRKKAKTFREYYETKYDLTISDLSQPLLEVILHSREIDCRSEKGSGKKSAHDSPNERLIPELVEFRTSPQSLTLRSLFLPAILYRVNSLASLSQLQEAVREMASSSCTDDAIYTPPHKKSKLEFDWENSSVGGDREGDSNQTTMTEPYQLLSKYFYPFDSSKSVPLLQLLEAVTSASANENFDLERLEMLGDSFLKMAVSIHVYWHKKHNDEGKLTKYRTRQISNKNLFNLANKQHLPEYINHSIFSKQTWIPPGFALLQRKGRNDNDINIHDVIRDDGGHEDNVNATDDVPQDDDTMHKNSADDVRDEVKSQNTTVDVTQDEDTMHKNAKRNDVRDDVKFHSTPVTVTQKENIDDATSDENVQEVTSVDDLNHGSSTVTHDDTMNEDGAEKAIAFDENVMKQQISDKCIADSVEALIGAHLMHCGYMGALGFMTWLGLEVFHRDSTENGKPPSDKHSKYANYPLPNFDVPEEEKQYEQILKQQTKEMESFEEKIGYKFKKKVFLLISLFYSTAKCQSLDLFTGYTL
jgi:dsRNA-specific ribonuclease